MSARTSGESRAGFKMSPSSPPVQQTRTVRTPSAWYLATVPGPFEASSSGWACTVRRHSGVGHDHTVPGRRRRPAPPVRPPDLASDRPVDGRGPRPAALGGARAAAIGQVASPMLVGDVWAPNGVSDQERNGTPWA